LHGSGRLFFMHTWLGQLIAAAPPQLTQEEQIQINLQALILVASLAALTIITVFVINKMAGKRRYAAHQAQLAAEGRLGRSSALSDIANGRPAITDDGETVHVPETQPGSIFGENYKPYGKDATEIS